MVRETLCALAPLREISLRMRHWLANLGAKISKMARRFVLCGVRISRLEGDVFGRRWAVRCAKFARVRGLPGRLLLTGSDGSGDPSHFDGPGDPYHDRLREN